MKKTTKTTKTTKTFTINFNPLRAKMKRAHEAPISLRKALIELWNAQKIRDEKVFRDEFILFAVENEYGRRWAMDVANKAGFKGRAAGGGRKKTKPAKNTAEAALAIVKALTLKERKRFVKMLAAI